MIDKFKVGLLDMLTLLLPGGLLIFILLEKGPVAKFIPADYRIMAGDANAWPRVLLFIAAAYVAGHFIYLLASNLDGWIYENVRKVFWNDHRLAAYILERKGTITGISDRSVINGFKWSCAWLLQHTPALYAEVERLMGESKFFRSLVVVCFISSILLGWHAIWGFALLMLVMAFLSLFRYLTQRQKSIDAAYVYMITALSENAPFPANPDREKLFELRSKSVAFLVSAGKALPYEIRTSERSRASFTGYIRKIVEVIKLCTWPWYIFDISPEGAPDVKCHELRWFTQTDPIAFKEWLLKSCGNICTPEERPDTYYVNDSIGEMSIKDRGREGKFEIKRKLPFDENLVLVPGVNVAFEGWYKWIVAQKDTDQLKNMLVKRGYLALTVEKKRWRNVIPGTDWQAEYTIVTPAEGSPTWYSIALELPYNVLPAEALESLRVTGIATVFPLTGACMTSYPAFLQDRLSPLTTS